MTISAQFGPSDLWDIVIRWVAERQREGKLSAQWGSVVSFNGDRQIVLHRDGMRNGPYIIIYDGLSTTSSMTAPRYEAHKYVNPRMGFVEVTGHCDAADPKFFDNLLNDMVIIQCAEALEYMGREFGSD